MHCIYCGMDYGMDDFCRCLPAKAAHSVVVLPRVDVPWGDAVAYWSQRPARENERQPRAQP